MKKVLTLESTAERRVAMLKLYHYVQALRGDLSQFLRTVETLPDRVMLEPWDVEYAEGFLRRCDQLRSTSEWVEVDPDAGRKHHGPTAFRSYRGRLPGGFMGDQWVLHLPPEYRDDPAVQQGYLARDPGVMAPFLHRVELDVDDHSPVDVVGIVGHIKDLVGHSAKGTQTDPRAQLVRLRDAGVRV